MVWSEQGEAELLEAPGNKHTLPRFSPRSCSLPARISLLASTQKIIQPRGITTLVSLMFQNHKWTKQWFISTGALFHPHTIPSTLATIQRCHKIHTTLNVTEQTNRCNNYYMTHLSTCLTKKQNATVGVGRQCLTRGRGGLTLATDSDVCRAIWIILCGHFSQMFLLAEQSVRNQKSCFFFVAHNPYLLLTLITRISGDMGLFWYVVHICDYYRI